MILRIKDIYLHSDFRDAEWHNILTVGISRLYAGGPEVILEWGDSHGVGEHRGDADTPLVRAQVVVSAHTGL